MSVHASAPRTTPTTMPARPLLAVVALLMATAPARACPFCSAESRTLTEEMNDSSVTFLGRLAVPSEASEKLADADIPYGFVDPDTGAARFTVGRVLLGQDLMDGADEIEAIYFGDPDTEREYLIRGVGDPPDWAIPLPLSEKAAAYVPKLLQLPESGADRLAFFQEHLEDEDPLLGQDAYDEFARAPYQDVIDLGPRMDRDQLRAWIEDYRVSPSRRRLFLTMLGVCGEAEDVTRLERMLTSDSRVLGPATDLTAEVLIACGGAPSLAMLGETVRFAERQRKLGLDALIACYLTLAGKHSDTGQALDLIDARFLKDPGADYSHVYAALQALRFLAEEQRDLVPIERLLASARLLLDNGDFADQVIPDLARWEDWSVLGRLTRMYESTFDADDEDAPLKYVREPIVTYLDVAAELPGEIGEEATAALARLEPLDPEAVERARSLRAFGFLAGARAKQQDAAAEQLGLDRGEVIPAASANASPDALADTPPNPMPPNPTPPNPQQPADPESPDSPPTPVVAGATPPEPPSRVLLIGVPMAAAATLVGLFWLILRGGVA